MSVVNSTRLNFDAIAPSMVASAVLSVTRPQS